MNVIGPNEVECIGRWVGGSREKIQYTACLHNTLETDRKNPRKSKYLMGKKTFFLEFLNKYDNQSNLYGFHSDQVPFFCTPSHTFYPFHIKTNFQQSNKYVNTRQFQLPFTSSKFQIVFSVHPQIIYFITRILSVCWSRSKS